MGSKMIQYTLTFQLTGYSSGSWHQKLLSMVTKLLGLFYSHAYMREKRKEKKKKKSPGFHN